MFLSFLSLQKINSCFLRFLAWKNYLHNFWAFLILQKNKFIFFKSLQTWNSCFLSCFKTWNNSIHLFWACSSLQKWNSSFWAFTNLQKIKFIFFEFFRLGKDEIHIFWAFKFEKIQFILIEIVQAHKKLNSRFLSLCIF